MTLPWGGFSRGFAPLVVWFALLFALGFRRRRDQRRLQCGCGGESSGPSGAPEGKIPKSETPGSDMRNLTKRSGIAAYEARNICGVLASRSQPNPALKKKKWQ
jgi:hypothetical protein